MKKIIPLLFLTFLSAQIFAASMEAKVRSLPPETSRLVFENPKEGLPLVVKHLTTGSSVNGAVKAIHDWICDNIAYDVDMYFSGKPSRQDYESVLKKKKALCSGYTNLMTQMCSLAGIEAIGIEGYSKGFGYTGQLGNGPDHAWNAVRMNAKWQLIDVTWDAGYVDYKTFIKKYSTEWLNRTPAQFSFSHLPQKEEYQYLTVPKSREDFVREPYIPGIFFEYGLALGKEVPAYTNELSAARNFDFKLTKQGVAVSAYISDMASGSVIGNAVWVDRMGSRIALDADIPTGGKYRCFIAARNRAEFSVPRTFSEADFEGKLLPQAKKLLSEKKITQVEFDHFTDYYFKVDENRRWYVKENLFATVRNNDAVKVIRLLLKDTAYSENVLYFDLISSEGYNGFGEGWLRFPSEYRSYMETSNTHLIGPVAGVLQKGSRQKFEVESKDYVGIALSTGGSLMPFSKDGGSGIYFLETEIPSDSEQVTVFGSKNGKNYAGLWFYKTE